MHTEAREWVSRWAGSYGSVLDIGGRDVNGAIRDLFDTSVYRVLDLLDAPDVDIVADAATWRPDRPYDLVVCCEVFEHTFSWRQICDTAFRCLKPGGLFIATMAGPGREAHSGIDGATLRSDEEYANISPLQLELVLKRIGFVEIDVDYQPNPPDTRCAARRPLT